MSKLKNATEQLDQAYTYLETVHSLMQTVAENPNRSLLSKLNTGYAFQHIYDAMAAIDKAQNNLHTVEEEEQRERTRPPRQYTYRRPNETQQPEAFERTPVRTFRNHSIEPSEWKS